MRNTSCVMSKQWSGIGKTGNREKGKVENKKRCQAWLQTKEMDRLVLSFKPKFQIDSHNPEHSKYAQDFGDQVRFFDGEAR
jgi:hypothetical protein